MNMGRFADTSKYTDAQRELWVKLIENEDKEWKTSSGLVFHYHIVGNEMFIDRKKKSITRAAVNKAFNTAVEIKVAKGPKKLLVFGASYLYPVFLELGICTAE